MTVRLKHMPFSLKSNQKVAVFYTDAHQSLNSITYTVRKRSQQYTYRMRIKLLRIGKKYQASLRIFEIHKKIFKIQYITQYSVLEYLCFHKISFSAGNTESQSIISILDSYTVFLLITLSI